MLKTRPAPAALVAAAAALVVLLVLSPQAPAERVNGAPTDPLGYV
jgi:hypothetical protein